MFHLGWFLTTGFGVYGWNQPWSGNVRSDVGRPKLFVSAAQSLEAAGFDYLMLEDASVLPDVFRGTFERSVRAGTHVRFDPMPLVPLLAAATERIGIIATVATTFYPPYLAARLMTTLDHLSDGRVGINLVTGSPHAAAQNFGRDQHVEHDLRYRMADEWVTLVKYLWQSWEPGAMRPGDPEVFADHEQIHTVDFRGEYYASRGPLNCPPGPQGRPVLCQAGGSPAGRAFAARHADTIVAEVHGVEAMREYRQDIARRAREAGRDPAEVKILYLVSPVLGDTDEQARARHDHARADEAAVIEGRLAAMSYFTSIDFSRFDLDAPFPDLRDNNGHRSTMLDMAGLGRTLREVATRSSMAGSVELVGSPDTVAARMQDVMQEVGGDGFLIANPLTRRNVAEIADGLAPMLRRRGLIREGYSHRYLRDNLLAF